MLEINIHFQLILGFISNKEIVPFEVIVTSFESARAFYLRSQFVFNSIE